MYINVKIICKDVCVITHSIWYIFKVSVVYEGGMEMYFFVLYVCMYVCDWIRNHDIYICIRIRVCTGARACVIDYACLFLCDFSAQALQYIVHYIYACMHAH